MYLKGIAEALLGFVQAARLLVNGCKITEHNSLEHSVAEFAMCRESLFAKADSFADVAAGMAYASQIA